MRRRPRTLIEAAQDLGDAARDLWRVAFEPPLLRLVGWLARGLNRWLRRR